MNVIGDVQRQALHPDRRHRRFRRHAGAMPPRRCCKKGATEVMAYITHGVLSGGAVGRIQNSRLKSLVITDSILPTEAVKAAKNIRMLSIAPLIGEAIPAQPRGKRLEPVLLKVSLWWRFGCPPATAPLTLQLPVLLEASSACPIRSSSPVMAAKAATHGWLATRSRKQSARRNGQRLCRCCEREDRCRGWPPVPSPLAAARRGHDVDNDGDRGTDGEAIGAPISAAYTQPAPPLPSWPRRRPPTTSWQRLGAANPSPTPSSAGMGRADERRQPHPAIALSPWCSYNPRHLMQ